MEHFMFKTEEDCLKAKELLFKHHIDFVAVSSTELKIEEGCDLLASEIMYEARVYEARW
jgi:hypothetical protein